MEVKRVKSDSIMAKHPDQAPTTQVGIADALGAVIDKQRQEILTALESASSDERAVPSKVKAKSKTSTRPVKMRIKLEGLTGETAKRIGVINSESVTVFEDLIAVGWIYAANHSLEARRAFDCGQIGAALKHFADAERAIGGVISSSQHRTVEHKIKAIVGHTKPGGSLDKQRQIRREWASGKYASRDICAEQECAALGMSFSSARKALRNTPDPT